MLRNVVRRIVVGCLIVSTLAVEVTPGLPVAQRGTLSSRNYGRQQNSSSTDDAIHQPTLYHAMRATFDGEEYILHQVHARAFWGIRPAEWDDNVHVMNNTDWFSKEVSQSLIRKELDDRDLVGSLCQATTTCAAWTQTIFFSQSTNLVSGVKTANQFLNDNPFFAQVVSGTIAGVAANKLTDAWVGGKSSGSNNNIQACSTLGDQIDALQSLILSQQSCYSTASMTVSAQQNDAGDEVSSITMTTIACGGVLPATECSISAGFC